MFLIYEEGKVRVLQHDHLQVYHVQEYGWCDNPRSYGGHYAWHVVAECYSIEEVRGIVTGILRRSHD